MTNSFYFYTFCREHEQTVWPFFNISITHNGKLNILLFETTKKSKLKGLKLVYSSYVYKVVQLSFYYLGDFFYHCDYLYTGIVKASLADLFGPKSMAIIFFSIADLSVRSICFWAPLVVFVLVVFPSTSSSSLNKDKDAQRP